MKKLISKQGYVPKRYDLRILQNENIEDSQTYDCDVVMLGSSITSQKADGAVCFKDGKTIINASSVIIEPSTVIEEGAEFIINPTSKN